MFNLFPEIQRYAATLQRLFDLMNHDIGCRHKVPLLWPGHHDHRIWPYRFLCRTQCTCDVTCSLTEHILRRMLGKMNSHRVQWLFMGFRITGRSCLSACFISECLSMKIGIRYSHQIFYVEFRFHSYQSNKTLQAQMELHHFCKGNGPSTKDWYYRKI
jgi:hypothetical protein